VIVWLEVPISEKCKSTFTRATEVGYIFLACISSSPIKDRVTSFIFFSINKFLPSDVAAFLPTFIISTRFAKTAPPGCKDA
jgi:hypothetical protein